MVLQLYVEDLKFITFKKRLKLSDLLSLILVSNKQFYVSNIMVLTILTKRKAEKSNKCKSHLIRDEKLPSSFPI